MILPDARAVVRAVEHSHAMARTGAPQSTNPTASSNSSRTRLPTACAGPTRLASDTCSLAGSRIRSSWEQLVFRRLASAAVNHGVHFAVSLPRERRMCLESGGIQPSTEVAMSEVTLEADIRGHDKNDANDPKRKSWNCLVDHLVGTGEHRETGGHGERFYRIQIDPQGQFRRILNGKAELFMGAPATSQAYRQSWGNDGESGLRRRRRHAQLRSAPLSILSTY